MKTIFAVARREFALIHSKRFFVFGLYLAPLLISILIFYIFQKPYITDLPTVCVDLDQTKTSRLFTRLLDSHRFIHITHHVGSYQEAKKELQSLEVYAVIYIPSQFEKDLKKGRQPTIRANTFAANLTVGKSLQKAITETITTINTGLQIKKQAIDRKEYEATLSNNPPIQLSNHYLYNPSLNYQWFLPPGTILALFQLLICLMASTMIASEWEQKTWLDLVALGKNPISIIIGKALPILIIFGFHSFILLQVLFPLEGIPVLGSLLIGYPLLLLFMFCCFCFGLASSIIMKDSFMATTLSVFFMSPALAFSGYTYPVSAFPSAYQIVALIMPTTHFLPVFTAFYLQNSPLSILLYLLLPMLALTIILLIPSIILLNRRIKNPEINNETTAQ